MVDDGLDTCAVAYAVALFFKRREIQLHCCCSQLVQLKMSPMPRTFEYLFGELAENAQ